MREIFVQISYLIASVFFILGLKSLSRADTAARGVNLAAVGSRSSSTTGGSR